MTSIKGFAALAAFFGLAFTSVAAFADEHPFTEGPVVQVSSIRTEYGKFDEYMKFSRHDMEGNARGVQEGRLHHRL